MPKPIGVGLWVVALFAFSRAWRFISAWRLTLAARSGADRGLSGNGCCYVLALVLPTLRMGAGRRFFEPGGRPGPGLPGFGAPAGQGMVARMLRNPRRTRAGVSRPGGAGFSQGRRRSAASGRARRSWAWAAM